MKIAFIGKGGSGKTTLAALFTHYLVSIEPKRPILAIDADINSHFAEALRLDTDTLPPALSSAACAKLIKTHLWNNSPRISKIEEIKKTTPPTGDSGYFWLTDPSNPLFTECCVQRHAIHFARVGTYESDGIGRSCYHNSLAILENVLSHTISEDGFVVVDMVAGTDAFASSMHAQFDLLVFAAEPTAKSMAVFADYARLAEAAGIKDKLFAVGNKILDDDDRNYITSKVPENMLLGMLGYSPHLRAVERGETTFDFDQMEPETKQITETLLSKLQQNVTSYNEKLERLHRLHRIYVSQDYVIARVGDLTGQIDEAFDFDTYVEDRKKQHDQAE